MTQPDPATAEPIEPAPPPSEDSIAQEVATVLLAAYAIDKTVDMLLALFRRRRRKRAVSEQAVRTALGLANHAARARPVFSRYDITRNVADTVARDIVRAVANDDVFFRAAYLENAAERVQERMDAGASPRDAGRAEAVNYKRHRDARQKRLDAAADVAKNAVQHGTLLGWYRNWMLDSDVDCIVADGNNFDAVAGTIIGYPGSVHAHCGCRAGPPHEDGIMVDEAIASWGKPPAVAVVRRVG